VDGEGVDVLVVSVAGELTISRETEDLLKHVRTAVGGTEAARAVLCCAVLALAQRA
jgi:hypothetical protein